MIGLGLATPALAGISRRRTGTAWINADAGARVTHEVTGRVTVASRLYANTAHHRARDTIISCVEEHSEMLMPGNRPHRCNQGGYNPVHRFRPATSSGPCPAAGP